MLSLRKALAAAAAMMAAAQALVSCEDEKHTYVANMLADGSTPTMVTTDVMTLISDSGYTRYHIDAPLWCMYEDRADPVWTFPDGIELEQYDDNMNATSHMRCDSAIYYSVRRLWRFDGHVVMVNVMRDTFLTQQMYWDQTAQRVYSDSFMHITRAQHIIEGFGFESNQNMTAYTVQRPTAIIPVNRSKPGSATTGGAVAADSTSADRGRGPRYAPRPASQRAGGPLPLPPATVVTAE